MQEDLKDRIRQIRSIAKLSQKDMARILNIPITTVSKYERGENKPSSDILAKIGDLLDINLNWLLTGKGQKHISNEQQKNISLNLETIEIIIRTVEETFLENKLCLESAKKAKLIRLIYEMFEENQIQKIDKCTILSFYKLAS